MGLGVKDGLSPASKAPHHTPRPHMEAGVYLKWTLRPSTPFLVDPYLVLEFSSTPVMGTPQNKA